MARSLSLIVPFYNEFAYLRDCLDSIKAQRLPSVETIIVNDNPSDATSDFAEKTAREYGVKVVHHEVNKGLSAARNTGVAAATGELMTFIDSDDYYASGGLSEHYEFAVECGSEMTHTPTIVRKLKGQLDIIDWDKKYFLETHRDVNIRTWPQTQFIASSWSSIYRMDFIERHGFAFDEEQRRFEDRLYVLEAVLKAETVSFTGRPTRIYRRRPGSITTARKADEDRLLQAKLSKKCVDLVAAEVKAGRLPRIYLERELMICLQRLIFHTGLADPALEESAEIAEARDVFAAIYAEHEMSASAYGDLLLLPISKFGGEAMNGRIMNVAEHRKIYSALRGGDWAEAGRVYGGAQEAASAKPGADGRAAAPLDAVLALHIGMHKTGTTHVQRRLVANRKRLEAAGVLFPRTGFRGTEANNARDGATPGHIEIDLAVRNRKRSLFEALEKEVAAASPRAVLISAENMSNPLLLNEGGVRFASWADEMFSRFPKRRVAAIYRRPDQFLDSYFRELVFLGNDEARKTPDRFALEFAPRITDLAQLFDSWAAFAGEPVRLMEYEAAKTAGVAESVLSLLGLQDVALRDDEGVTYPSLSRSAVIAAQTICAQFADRAIRSRALGCFVEIIRGVEDRCDGPMLSKLVRRQLIERLRGTSADYAAAHGLDLPCDAWLADIDGSDDPEFVDPVFLDKARIACDMTTRAVNVAAPDWKLKSYRYGKSQLLRLRASI